MLILARLGCRNDLQNMLRYFFSTDVFYSTGMTDHNTDRNRGVFCTDTLLGLQGVIQEMLLYSDEKCIILFPGLPLEWNKGVTTGLRMRCHVLAEELCWNFEEGYVRLRLIPDCNFNGVIKIDIPGFKLKGQTEQQNNTLILTHNQSYSLLWEKV